MFVGGILPFILINKKLIYIRIWLLGKKKPTNCHELSSGKMVLLYELFIHDLLLLIEMLRRSRQTSM